MGIDLVASLLVLSGTALGAIFRPKECYTCQSPLDSPVCGEGFKFHSFLQKYCLVNQVFCLKVIEIAGRSPLVYRKCSHDTCEQEAKKREGEIVACSTCTNSLCNASTISFTVSPIIYFQIIIVIFYHLNIISLLGQN